MKSIPKFGQRTFTWLSLFIGESCMTKDHYFVNVFVKSAKKFKDALRSVFRHFHLPSHSMEHAVSIWSLSLHQGSKKIRKNPVSHATNQRALLTRYTYSRSCDVTVAMLVYRTIAKEVFWEFDSIIMQNLSDIVPLFCTPKWPSHHVGENQG